MGYIGQAPSNKVLDSSDIADGSVTVDDLSSTLNLSSKTVTLPANSVTAHVTEYNDANIRSDILKLAIHQATEGNRLEFNLTDSYIDGFERDDGLATQTNVDRNIDGEYIGTSSSAYGATQNLWEISTTGTAVGTGFNNYTFRTRVTAISATAHRIRFTVTTTGAGDLIQAGFGVADSGSTHGSTNWDTVATPVEIKWGGTSGASGASQVSDWLDFTVSSSNDYIFTSTNGDHTNTYWYTSGFPTDTASCSQAGGTSGFGTLVADVPTDDSSAYVYFVKKIEGQELVSTVNATGTLISDPITASSSRTSASGCFIYSDESGSATLGTDLKLFFSCDNGSNWQEASSYSTPVVYSGTKKLVTCGATTCVGGSQIKLKAEWANQVAEVTGGYQTGDQSGNITLTSTVQESGNGTASNLIDGVNANDTTNGFHPYDSTAITDDILKFDFGSGKIIDEAKFYQPGNTESHGTWKWQGSNDDSSWTDIGSSFTLGGGVAVQTQTELNGNTTSYRYYQLLGISGNTTYPAIWGEIQFKIATIAGKETRLESWAVNF